MPISRRIAKIDPKIDPGPYEAVVVSHLDNRYMGSLVVELLTKTKSNSLPERTNQIVQVRYLSPFYGVTPLRANAEVDKYDYTQKSYGMWFIPPDVGTKVLVIFAEGDFSQGYWIGCIQDKYMNFMIPGYAATELITDSVPERFKGKKLPAGEYNKKLEIARGNDPTRYLKPYNIDFTNVLWRQGLLEDEIRGTTTSSARREVPSTVFGISTPGPVDKRSGAPQVDYGVYEYKSSYPVNRLGGSSLVFDDGDDKFLRKGDPSNTPSEYANVEAGESGGDVTLPQNELVRLRTRTGHQILLHNTEDLIYIANAKGTTWIELTSNGKIDIYAKDSISIHSAVDLNFTADRDINFTCNENMNMVIGGEFRQAVGKSSNIIIEKYLSTNVGKSITENAGEFIANYAGTDITQVAAANFDSLAGANLIIGAKGNLGILADGDIGVESDSNIGVTATGNYAEKATRIDMNGPEPTKSPTPDPELPVEPILAEQTARQPQHEPWYEHESFDPLKYTPDKTRAGQYPEASDRILTSDTFRKSTTTVADTTPRSGGRPSEIYQNERSPRTTPARTITSQEQQVLPGEPLEESKLQGTIDGFTREETASYLGAIGQRESNNNYKAVNSLGYVGKYQFGTAALVDNGYVKRGTSGQRALNNPNVWTGKNGINSKEDWLNSPQVQEVAMLEYTNKNKRYLIRNGGIQSNDDKATQAGMLAGAHLLGAGGMNKWRRGEGGADAYGTTGDEYFAIGKSSINRVSAGGEDV